MKKLLLIVLVFTALASKAQKVDSMFVHLYTDSLKKGTFNYINVDGLLANGNWLPLDSNHIEFKCSHGEFNGNELWVDPGFSGEKINITTTLKTDRTQYKSFDMYIKKKPDDELLPSEQDIINNKKKKKNS
ncbi:MAG: hypothetical protein EOO13_07365 [Chitinophagaceae bacterium]|nr:MAG: hypothetical protein EOO13_07365 [Chitinophagaceae bacterium]